MEFNKCKLRYFFFSHCGLDSLLFIPLGGIRGNITKQQKNEFFLYKKYLKILLFIFVFSGKIFSQQYDINFKTFSSKDGIYDISITSIVKDQRNILWFGTPSGLYLYDGHLARPYRDNKILSSCRSKCLLKDNNGKIWVGTYSNGLFSINVEKNRINHYLNSKDDTASIASNRINALAQDEDGNIWIATEKNGINKYISESNRFLNIKISDNIKSGNLNRVNTVLAISHDPYQKGILWLGTLDGLVKYNTMSGEMKKYKCSLGNIATPRSFNSRENTVKAIYCDKDVLYLGTWGGGLCVFDKSSGNWDCIKFQSAFPASGMRNDVTQIVPKSQDQLWVLSYKQPLGIFSKKDRKLNFLSKKNIKVIYPDDDNNFWFGTDKNELLALFPQMEQFKKTRLPYALENTVFSPDNNSFYSGIFFKNILLKYNLTHNNYKTYTFSPFFDKGKNFITGIQFDKNNNIYLLGLTGLYKFDEEKEKILKVWSPFDYPGNENKIISTTTFYIDKKENCWMGTKFDGLYVYNIQNGKVKHYAPYKEEAHTAWISSFMEDNKGNIWFGSGRGFGYYSPKKDSFIEFQNSIENTIPDTLPFTSVSSIFQDKNGIVWIGSLKKGLGYFEPKNKSEIKIHTFTTESSDLSDDRIFEISSDKKGDIWVLTGNGISKIYGYGKKIVNFGKESGLFGLRNIGFDGKNKMFLSSNSGFYSFNPDEVQPDASLPEIHITGFKIFNKEYKSEKNIDFIDTIFLTYKQNFFSVEFTGINYSNPDKIHYDYMLEGLKDQWISTGKRRYIDFTNVGGGEYDLKIRATIGKNRTGKIKSIKIIITPPFWQTLWFRIIFSIVLLSLIYAAIHYRIKNIRKKEQIKREFENRLIEVKLVALQSRMNPHFLFNSLNSIKLLTLEKQTDKASAYLTKFSKLIRLILRSSNSILVPLSDEIELLKLYIEMEALRFDDEFEYKITVSPDINVDKYQIPPMIIQVFVENAIKHGLRAKESNKKLEIDFDIDHSYIRCTVWDNGIGRKAASQYRSSTMQQKESMGINIARERLTHIYRLKDKKARVDILDMYENEIAAGTKVTIFFPIITKSQKSL